MKKLLSLILALVMVVTCLAGISFAADPIAEVTTGSNTVKVNTRQELFDALSPTGTSVVKLLKDVTETSTCKFPYSHTMDLNGFTWKTEGAGNAIWILAAGSENNHTVVKNGTLDAHILGVRIDTDAGTFEVDNCTVVSKTSCAVASYSTNAAITEKNVINNCVLVSVGGNGAFSWNANGTDTAAQNGMNVTISNTKMVQPQTGKNVFYCRDANAADNANTVTLGENVEIYTADEAALSIKSVKLAGKELTAAESTAIEVLGVKYEGLKKFVTTAAAPAAPAQPETPAAPAQPETPAAPAADAIATVVTGDKTVEVKNLEELIAAIDASGKTVVTLQKDISNDAAIVLPYTCTIDFNGKTIATNPEKGNGIQVTAAGTEEKVMTVKNGTLKHYEVGVRVAEGNVVIDNMKIYSDNGSPSTIYDTNEGATVTIKNSFLSTDNYTCFNYNVKEADFSKSTLTIENTTMVSYKQSEKGQAVIGRQSNAVPGNIVFGKGVEMYSYYNSYNEYPFSPTVFTNVTGEPVTKAEGTFAVDVNGTKVEGLFKWTTPVDAPAAPVQPETPATPAQPETPAAPAQPETPAAPVQPETPVQPVTPSVPSTNVPDVEVPKTGASVMALGIMAMVSLAGAVISKKN